MMYRYFLCWSLLVLCGYTQAQSNLPVNNPASFVNVFLGTSGDHGQLSPAASYPFGMLSIGPQTYPHIHTGYEYAAREFLGFTHTRVEGVGCMGSGGNLLIKPFLGKDPDSSRLIKTSQRGGAGWYNVSFENGITAALSVLKNTGSETYTFPAGNKGFFVDLSQTLANSFVDEMHTFTGNSLQGWIDARTTCNVGTYRIYYHLKIDKEITWKEVAPHKLVAQLATQNASSVHITVGISSVNETYAKASAQNLTEEKTKDKGIEDWNRLLNRVQVSGDKQREELFYSLLYRTMQSPYQISEPDGRYRTISGEEKVSQTPVYNGWSVWDNYKTQLPMLSLWYPERYQNIITSLADLYRYGKRDYATQHEPSNTVRTEHTIVVLLDAYRKGYHVPFADILDSLIHEVDHLDFSSPDKALEYSYDTWALSEICTIVGKDNLAKHYAEKALGYKTFWTKDFKDTKQKDLDRMGARGLYQGTIWQYRWFVPFDIKGLIALDSGSASFTQKLNYFFDHDLYNAANEPDIQVPSLFNASAEPWRAQEMMHKYAVDTVVQYYFNDNSRGIDPFVDRVYKNEPQAYVRTMDDDAGAMSAWFVLAATGVYPACVGYPVYYLNVPLFPKIIINYDDGKKLTITVDHFSDKNIYIQDVWLNGQKLERNYLTQKDLVNGGSLLIKAGASPNKNRGLQDQWISSFEVK